MEAAAVGQLIVNLHRNLGEIRASLDANGGGYPHSNEAVLLQTALDRAESALRVQARELLGAAAGLGNAPADPTAAFSQHVLATGLHSASPMRYSDLLQANQRRIVAPQLAYPAAPAALFPIVRSPPPVHTRSGSMDGRRRPVRAPTGGRRDRSKTTIPLRILPKINRLDPLADPPAVTERDLQAGLLNLSTRGFIPPSADLTPAMERSTPVIVQRPALLYDQAVRHERREIAAANEVSMVKLDLRQPDSTYLSSFDDLYAGTSVTSSPRMQARSSRQLPPLLPPPGISPRRGDAMAMSALPAPSFENYANTTVTEAYGTFCTELLDTAGDRDDAEKAMVCYAQAIKPSQEQVRARSVTKITACWRGFRQRKRFAKLRLSDKAARRVQSAWTACTTRMATKIKIRELQDEERRLQTCLMYDLGQEWFQGKQLRRVEIHVCSLTIPEYRRDRMESYQALQAAQIARIFRLIDPKRDVIFVAPKFLHDDILDYFSKIMQFRGVRNPPGRFQIVVPENMGLIPNMSLTQGLLCSPKALRRIRKLANARQAYLVPEAVTHSELKLSSRLRIPLLGAGSRNMALLSSKSNAKKLAQLAALPTGPWAVDIYDEDEFFTSLAGLVVKHPQVRTWVFKIDDERESRGTAYIDMSKMQEVAEVCRNSGHSHTSITGGGRFEGGLSSAQPSEEVDPAVIGADATEVRYLLQRHVPRRAVMCNRRVHPDFASWLAEACRVGAVIQAVPDSIVSQTSVHLQIDPDGTVNVLGTSEAIMCQPFVRAASWYPHSRGSWEVLQEIGLRMGRTLAAKGLVGFASVDAVFSENPYFDPAYFAEAQREPTPAVIGGGTPVEPHHLMFSGLRSPSPETSEAGSRHPYTSESTRAYNIPESRQADYALAEQLKDAPVSRALDPVTMMLGSSSSSTGPCASRASPYACWVVDVDARLTDEAAAIFPLQFVAQVRHDAATGQFLVTRDAQAEGEEASKHLSEAEKIERSQRWTIVSHIAKAPGLEKMSYQSLFQLAKMRGVSFDLFHNIGCVFTFLDVFHSLLSVLAVERTAEDCAKRLSSALGALAEGSQQAKGSRAAKLAPRDAMLLPGRESEASDCLTVIDVLMSLRTALKRWTEKPRQP